MTLDRCTKGLQNADVYHKYDSGGLTKCHANGYRLIWKYLTLSYLFNFNNDFPRVLTGYYR